MVESAVFTPVDIVRKLLTLESKPLPEIIDAQPKGSVIITVCVGDPGSGKTTITNGLSQLVSDKGLATMDVYYSYEQAEATVFEELNRSRREKDQPEITQLTDLETQRPRKYFRSEQEKFATLLLAQQHAFLAGIPKGVSVGCEIPLLGNYVPILPMLRQTSAASRRLNASCIIIGNEADPLLQKKAIEKRTAIQNCKNDGELQDVLLKHGEQIKILDRNSTQVLDIYLRTANPQQVRHWSETNHSIARRDFPFTPGIDWLDLLKEYGVNIPEDGMPHVLAERNKLAQNILHMITLIRASRLHQGWLVVTLNRLLEGVIEYDYTTLSTKT